jgi:hypothetical protein
MKKGISYLVQLPIPKEQIDLIMKVVCPPEGEERCLKWVRNDEGELDLYVEKGREK